LRPWAAREQDRVTGVGMARTIGAVLAILASVTSGAVDQEKKPPTPVAARTASDTAAQRRILEMFARAYFPGRSGQLMIAPREGHFITRNEPDVTFMHGSPWPYDVAIPLLFAGPAVKPGVYPTPAAQQDVAPTLAAALGVRMPTTATGRVLPILRPGFARPKAVLLIVLGYDETAGVWRANDECFRFPAYLKDRQASALWSTSRTWLDHPIDAPAAVRRSALFPAFEADAITTILEREPLGADDVADLVLLNYKGADFVGHPYGPESNELRVTMAEMDRHLARIIGALEAKVGKDHLIAVTADHGMPSAPPEGRHFSVDVVDLLHQKFDPQEKKLVSSYEGENAQLFINMDRLRQLGLTLRDLGRFLESQPFVFSVFTEDGVRVADPAGKRLTKS
jgi:hypothetical protein